MSVQAVEMSVQAVEMSVQAVEMPVQAGRQDEATLRFYQQAGFEAGVKTGFVAKR